MIYKADSLEGILGLDRKIDLLITDPPYAFGGSGDEHEISATVAVTLREAATRMNRGAWAVVFCASSWRSTQYMADAMRGILTPVRTGTWVKPQSRSKVRTPGWAWASVNVLVLRKGKSEHGCPSELLDWIEAPPVMNGRRAELPAAVADWSVAPFVVPGGLAVDPFAGSGALIDAAERAGMEGIGYERNPLTSSCAITLDEVGA